MTNTARNERAPELVLERADAVQWLRTLPDGCADLVVTDPPYESLEKHRAVGTTTRLTKSNASSNEWFEIFPNRRLTELMRELYRVLGKNTHCYVFCDQETMFTLKPAGEDAGFRFWKPIVWDKMTMGMGYHYRARYELVLFFEKGKRKLTDLSVPDVLQCKRITGGYPTEKPVDLMRTLIAQSSQPGDLVLDPFFGSGATLLASRRLGRHAWGTDSAPTAHGVAITRLAGEGHCEAPPGMPSQETLFGHT